MLSGLFGAFMMLLVVLIVLVVIWKQNPWMFDLHQEKIQTKEETNWLTVSVTNRAIVAGEIISQQDVTRQRIRTEEGKVLTYLQENCIGNRARIDLATNTILSKDLVYKGDKITSDMRIHNFHYIRLTDKLTTGDFVDIRISFANGADFILLSKKEIQDISLYNADAGTDNTIWLAVTEEEILRLSSAVVDAYLQKGCSIYAVEYLDQTQVASTITYPVNTVVKELIETSPNIVQRAANVCEADLREQITSIEGLRENQSDLSITSEDDLQSLLGKQIEGTKENNLETSSLDSNEAQEGEKVEFLD